MVSPTRSLRGSLSLSVCLSLLSHLFLLSSLPSLAPFSPTQDSDRPGVQSYLDPFPAGWPPASIFPSLASVSPSAKRRENPHHSHVHLNLLRVLSEEGLRLHPHAPSSSPPWVGHSVEAQREPPTFLRPPNQWGQRVFTAGFFPLAPGMGQEASWQPGPGGRAGWGRSALSPERAASSALEHSCRADSDFPSHVVAGGGQAWAHFPGLSTLSSQAPFCDFDLHPCS